jgi:hypothetical protein
VSCLNRPSGRLLFSRLSRAIVADDRYGLNDIRTLVGHKVDLGQVKTAAAVRLGEADRA